MRRTILLSALFAGYSLTASAQAPPTLEDMWAIIQQQQAEIDELRDQLAAAQLDIAGTEMGIDEAEQMAIAASDYVESFDMTPAETRRTTVGGYGELHYNNHSATDPSQNLEEIDLHRFVLFFGHRFSDRVSFVSELELEHSLVGDGAPGEAELEQAYLDFSINRNLAAQGGLFLVPVGILNEMHEPPTFYGVERNDVESIIIPSTWWEAGGALSGSFADGLYWNAAVHSGLAIPTTGSSAFRVRSGRQKVAEALASDPAYTFRLRYIGTPGLVLAASYQYQSDPSQVIGDGLDSGSLFTAHAIYQSGPLAVRALYGKWWFDGAAVEAAGADQQWGWFIEPSYRLNNSWGIYARYERIDAARVQDKFTEWEAGFSYWPVPDVVLKMDYRTREHTVDAESGRDFDGLDLGIGYQF